MDIAQPPPCTADVSTGVPPSLTAREVVQLQYLPKCRVDDWLQGDIANLVNRMWHTVQRRQVPFCFDCEVIRFSRPPSSQSDIVLGCYVNVLRWVGTFLSSACWPPVSRIRIAPGRHERFPTVHLYTSKGLAVTITFDSSGPLGPCTSVNWGPRLCGPLQGIVDASASCVYHIITNYTTWLFVEILDCDVQQGLVRCRCYSRNISDRAPSVRECIAGLLANDTKRLSCRRRLLRIVDANKSICRQTAVELGQFPIFTYQQLLGHEYLLASRPNDPTNVSATIRRYRPKYPGLVDMLYDSVPLAAGKNLGNHRTIKVDKYSVFEKTYSDGRTLRFEVAMYHRLCYLQGRTIPYFYGINVSDPYDNTCDRRPGILVEFIDSAHSIAAWWKSKQSHAKREGRLEVKHRALIVCRRLAEAQLAHRDITNSLLVRTPDLSIVLVGLSKLHPSDTDINTAQIRRLVDN